MKYLLPLLFLLSACAVSVDDIGDDKPAIESESIPNSVGPGDGRSEPPRCRPILGPNLELLGYTCAVPAGPLDPVLEREILDEELKMEGKLEAGCIRMNNRAMV